MNLLVNHVAEIRKRKGVSQIDLAERLKITPSYLSKIEKGERNLSRKLAIRIAYELDCSVKEIFFGK